MVIETVIPPEPPPEKPDRAPAPAPVKEETSQPEPPAVTTNDGTNDSQNDSTMTVNQKAVKPSSGKGFGQPMTVDDSKKSPAAPTEKTPQLTPPEQLNHGDRVEFIPYYGNPNAPREMIYVEPWKDGRHYVCPPEHFKKGMKGSRQYCSVPRLANGNWKDDIFWKV